MRRWVRAVGLPRRPTLRAKSTHVLGRSGRGGGGGSSGGGGGRRRQGSSASPQAELAGRVDPLWGPLRGDGAARAALSSQQTPRAADGGPAVGDSDPAQLRGATYTGSSAVLAEAAGQAHSVHEREAASKMQPEGGATSAHARAAEVGVAASDPPPPAAREAKSTDGQAARGAPGRAFSLVGSTSVAQAPHHDPAPPEPVPTDILTLERAHPEFAAQWDHELNPENLSVNETPVKTLLKKKCAWSCSVAPDHKWWATLLQRQKNPRCPFCADKRVSVTNSLATVHPEIAAHYHPTLNRPDATLPGGLQQVRAEITRAAHTHTA